MIKLKKSELKIGSPLKWHIFDEEGHLLFKPGAIIASERQIESLLTRGAFRNQDPKRNTLAEAPEPKSNKFVDSTSIKVASSLLNLTPFDIIHNIFHRLRLLFESIDQNPVKITQQTAAIASILIQLHNRDKEVVIGAVRQMHEYDYTLCHPVHTTILSILISKHLKYGFNRQLRLACAALTQNVSMNALQELLQEQKERPFEEQQTAIDCHPEASATMLKYCGVTDKKWLNIIKQHHERPDGEGYPQGLKQDEILQESMIIGLADRYAAMLSGRVHRKGMPTEEVIETLGHARGTECDQHMVNILIGALGVYPPGSFVKLRNNETAIVTRRTRNPKRPVVSSYVDPFGEPYNKPIIRDLNHKAIDIAYHTTPDLTIPVDLNIIWGFKKG